MSQDLGFLVPPVHIRDNLELLPSAYRITPDGGVLGEGEVFPDRHMAINPGQVFGPLPGAKTQDPAFGLEAIWIDESLKDQAQTLGYTVVDASTVVATHLNQIIQKHTHELLGHEEVQNGWTCWRRNPQAGGRAGARHHQPQCPAEGAANPAARTGGHSRPPLHRRSLGGLGDKSQDIATLVGHARVALARQIVQNIVGSELAIPCITLEPSLEHLLLQSYQQAQKLAPMQAPLSNRAWPSD